MHQLTIVGIVWMFRPFLAAIMIDTFKDLIKDARRKPSVLSVEGCAGI